MWVVKLGGSLQGSTNLKDWLRAVADHGGGKIVLVPGGGKYADKVRQDQIRERFSDREAHILAIRAMEQFARDLCESQPRLQSFSNKSQLVEILQKGGVPVWLPSEMVIGQPDLPESWDVTSDSLALWLAQKLACKGLIIVKHVNLGAVTSLEKLADAGVVDGYFPELYQKGSMPLRWYRPEQHQHLNLYALS